MDSPSLTIGRLAGAAGVGVETVRYYQRRGLIGTPHGAAGVRRYGKAELARLRFIRHAQRLGFSLDEVAGLLDLDEMTDRNAARKAALDKLGEIEEKIHRLETMRRALADLVRCCEAGPGAEPCPILHTLSGVEELPLP
ncbi:MAG: MerR family DNA-binding protein [Zoogloeaceae bacterium]|nr:MerR family DNA-binding protein [Zoogloeaceae bacterium]